MSAATNFSPNISTTAHVAALNRVYAGGADLPPGALTPETLLAYCASKMRGLDGQIQACFAKQQARNAKSEALSKLATAMNTWKVGFEGNPKAKAEIEAALKEAKASLAGDPALSEQLANLTNAFNETAKDKTGHVDSDEMNGFMSTVQSMQQSINQDGELEMLQMQSMMSQRQQALQLCTNMIQSLGQSSQAICSNVGK
jgi:hypothetical protein